MGPFASMLWQAWISRQRTRDVPVPLRGLVAMDRTSADAGALAGIAIRNEGGYLEFTET